MKTVEEKKTILNFDFMIKIDYQFLFFCAYILLFLYSMTEYSNIEDLFGQSLTNLIARSLYFMFLCLCLLLVFFQNKYSSSEFLSLLLIVCIGGLSYFFSGDHNFLDWLLIVYFARNIDFKKFLKRILLFHCVFCGIIVLMSGFGLISTWSKVRTESGRVRFALGFNHANTLGMVVFQIIAEYMLLSSSSKKFLKYIVILIIAVFTYRITDSQTFLIASLFLITFFFMFQLIAQKFISRRQIKKIVKLIFPIALITLILIIWYYWRNTSELGFITLRARINLAQRYLNAYGVTVFGSPIEQGANVIIPGYSSGYFYLDNAQVWLLIKYGVVCNILFYIICVNLFRGILKDGDIYMLIVASAFLIYSLAESGIYKVQFNFMFVYAGILMFQRISGRKRKYNYLRTDKIKNLADNDN